MKPRSRCPLIALTLAPGIAAAGIVDVEWSVSNQTLTPDHPTTTVLMTATWSEDDAICFAYATFDILGANTRGGVATGSWNAQGYIPLGNNMIESEALTDLPDDDNNLSNGWAFCPIFFGGVARSPMKWWFNYTATDFTPRTAEYTSVFSAFLLYTDTFGSTIEDDPIITPVVFEIIPSPASVWPLALLTVLPRRRRA